MDYGHPRSTLDNFPATVYISKSVDANPQGHYSSLYNSARDIYKKSYPNIKYFLFAQESANGEKIIPFFPPEANIQGNVFTPFTLGLLKFNKFRREFAGRSSSKFVIYEGELSTLIFSMGVIASSKKNSTIFNFHHSNYWVDFFTSKKISFRILKHLLKRFISLSKGRFMLSAESSKLARLINEELDTYIDVFPVVSAFSGSAGNGNITKNIDVSACPMGIEEVNFCLEVFNSIRSKNNDIKIAIQPRGLDSEQIEHLIEICSANFYQLISFPLSEPDHIAFHKNSKVIFFPYSAKFYEYGSSGRVQDSILFQAVPVVPKQTAMGEWLGQKGIPTYQLGDIESAVQSIIRSLSILPVMLPKTLTSNDLVYWVEAKNPASNTKDNGIFEPAFIPLCKLIYFASKINAAFCVNSFQLARRTWIVEYQAIRGVRNRERNTKLN